MSDVAAESAILLRFLSFKKDTRISPTDRGECGIAKIIDNSV